MSTVCRTTHKYLIHPEPIFPLLEVMSVEQVIHRVIFSEFCYTDSDGHFQLPQKPLAMCVRSDEHMPLGAQIYVARRVSLCWAKGVRVVLQGDQTTIMVSRFGDQV